MVKMGWRGAYYLKGTIYWKTCTLARQDSGLGPLDPRVPGSPNGSYGCTMAPLPGAFLENSAYLESPYVVTESTEYSC
jgi:hypothetical protein